MAHIVMTNIAAVPNRTLPLPELLIQRLKDTPQNPRYHAEGSVYNHTQMVLDQYFQYAQKHPLTSSEKTIFYWAAVLHDLGKTEVTKYEWGRWRSKGHEEAGVSIARDILLEQKEINSYERRAILDLVRWHFVPLRWGLRQYALSAYLLLATQTDIRLLGIFGEFDIRGRLCEDKGKVVQLAEQFNQEIVPRVHQKLGTFSALQQQYQSFGTQHKDALWSALTNKEHELLLHLLKMRPSKSKRKAPHCVVTIGTPRAGKSLHLAQNYSPYQRFDNSKIGLTYQKEMRLLEEKIATSIDRHINLAIDGLHLDAELRQQLAQHIRALGAKLHYLYFERSWKEIQAQNQLSTTPMAEKSLWTAHKKLLFPHPWEAHSIQLV